MRALVNCIGCSEAPDRNPPTDNHGMRLSGFSLFLTQANEQISQIMMMVFNNNPFHIKN